MRTKDYLIERNETLVEAFAREGIKEIETNVIIDKTLTGIGATYWELHLAKRPSIIIEPNVPVIIGKAEKVDNSLAVYALCTKTQVKNFLKNKSITNKKLLTTPEGFEKIRKAARELGIDIYKEFFCLFDECEKITQDVDYRPRISQPINDFFKFEKKAMVSATPLEMHHPELEHQNFKIWKIVPNFDYKKNMTLIVTRSFNRTMTGRLRELIQNSQCLCIFFNSTMGINKVITYLLNNNLIKEEDYKVYCSNKSVKALKECNFKNSHENLDLPLARINFFTCRFFSAVDIYTVTKPDILVLSDCNIPHSIVDPYTEVIQAQGRFRNKYADGNTYNSLTVISNINEEMEVMTGEEISAMIRQFETTYQNLNQRLEESTTEVEKKAILKDLEKVRYTELLDEEGEINYFSVDNLYNEERVKGYYTSARNLHEAYEGTGHFNINFTDDTKGLGEDDKLAMRKASKKQLWKKVVSHLDRLQQLVLQNPDHDITPDIEILRAFEDAGYIMKAYDTIGKAAIEQADYKKGEIDKMIKTFHEQKAHERRFSPDVVRDVFKAFEQEMNNGEYIPNKVIRERLRVIFMAHGIPFKEYGVKVELEKVYFTLTDKTIEDYYSEFKVSNANGGAYRLVAMKPELVENFSKGIRE
ncbi:hypothetical protein [Gabonibacter chumensis]|uniref:hypothetical protein n=1 Tax=Gabonibacter chumensis TaxID=2972474 RepID=UPI0025739D41|nr:hypothetical protein [Gabonibacter chumensis]MCR9010839.1 hypothetical protein [Gabonibacter chumensis]